MPSHTFGPGFGPACGTPNRDRILSVGQSRDWLDDVLRTQISRMTGQRPDTPITFDELHAATKIELNVVAADLSMRCHLVFSYIETPNCAVADAVVASSSIPFGFPVVSFVSKGASTASRITRSWTEACGQIFQCTSSRTRPSDATTGVCQRS